MTTMLEPISGEELLGYLAAMSMDLPLGEPETELD
jgi:hypothetical protein